MDEVKRTYVLEMSAPGDLKPKRSERTDFEVRRVGIPCPELNWFMHQAVGAEFRWGGREDWGRDEWARYVDRPELETWIGYVSGTPAGYYELEKQDDGSVRIECFGLRRQFFGQGLGSPFLTLAIERCWAMGANRVWLTTCSHDHPHALENYLARGFKLIDGRTGAPNRARASSLFSTAG